MVLYSQRDECMRRLGRFQYTFQPILPKALEHICAVGVPKRICLGNGVDVDGRAAKITWKVKGVSRRDRILGGLGHLADTGWWIWEIAFNIHSMYLHSNAAFFS